MRRPPRSKLVDSFVAMVLSCDPGGSLGKTQWENGFLPYVVDLML